jgi:DNA polymerase III subunit epsilon
MKLNLKKPIAFFDLETTGIDVVNDRIVEISILKILPDGSEETKTMRINPTIPISAEATNIHGITAKDVKDKPKFAEVAKSLAKFLEGCDLAGYNSNKFDIPMLVEEFLRADVDFDIKKRRMIDVQVIFHKMEQRTLGAAYKFYCNKDLVDAHTAESDAKATFEVLESQLDKYQELENDIESLAKFSSHTSNVDFAGKVVYNDDGVEVFNFGKHKGTPVEEVFKKEPGFYKWMMNGDFPLYTKKVITAIQLRMAFAKSTVK